MRGSWVFRAILTLYPPWWRARYGEEVRATCADVMAAGRSPWRVLGNLAFGAVRTRLRGTNMPMQFECWAGRTRASIVIATVPVLAVFPAIFTFQQGQQRASTPPGTLLFGAGGLGVAGRVAEYAFAVMALALLLAVSTLMWGYLNLAGAVRRGSPDDRRLRWLVRLPGLSGLAAFALWSTMVAVQPRDYINSRPLNGHPLLAHGLGVAAAACVGLGFAAALVMVALVVRRARLSVSALASGRSVALASSALLWVGALAGTTSMVALGQQHSGPHSSANFVTTSWGQWWILGVLLLMAAAAISSLGTASASRSLRVAAQLRP
jgi:hypothetical protein